MAEPSITDDTTASEMHRSEAFIRGFEPSNVLSQFDLNRNAGANFVADLKVIPVTQIPNSEYDQDCPICQETYIPEDPIQPKNPVQLTCCLRAFHRECLHGWLSKSRNNTCPNCRKQLFLKADLDLPDTDSMGRGSDDDEDDEAEARDDEEEQDSEINEYIHEANTHTWLAIPFERSSPYEHNETDSLLLQRLISRNRAPLGTPDQYRALLRSGGDRRMEPLPTNQEPELSRVQQIVLFRELQRRGAFELEGMRRMYWGERGWRNFETWEHLVDKGTTWCVEHGRWVREEQGGRHRHLNFMLGPMRTIVPMQRGRDPDGRGALLGLVASRRGDGHLVLGEQGGDDAGVLGFVGGDDAVFSRRMAEGNADAEG